MNIDEFLFQYEQGRRDFSRVEFGSVYFRSFTFQDLNFSYSDWSESIFEDCSFINVNFQHASLIGIEFIDTSYKRKYRSSDLSSNQMGSIAFKNIDFSYADLTLSSLEYLDLRSCIFASSCLDGSSFQYSNLSGVNLSNASLISATFFSTDLIRANLSKANLTAAYLQAEWSRPWTFNDFTDANLSQALFRDTTLWHARFAHTNLVDTNFQGADLDNASFYGSDITAALNLTRLSGDKRSLPFFSYEKSGPATEFMDQICSLLKGVYGACSEFPYLGFHWPVIREGELNLHKLLCRAGLLTKIEESQIDKKLRNCDLVQDSEFIALAANIVQGEIDYSHEEIISHLDSIQLKSSQKTLHGYSEYINYAVFKLAIESIKDYVNQLEIYELFDESYGHTKLLFLGQIYPEKWIGLTLESRMEINIWSERESEVDKNATSEQEIVLKQADINLRLESLKSIFEQWQDLWWMGETLNWDFASQKESVFLRLLYSSKLLYSPEMVSQYKKVDGPKCSIGLFEEKIRFRGESYSREALSKVEISQRTQQATDLFKLALDNLQLYEIKQGSLVHIYYLGQILDRDWVGFYSQARD